MARFRSLVLESITEDDLKGVVRKLVAKAKVGERWAIRELLDRTVGKGVQPVEVEASDDSTRMDVTGEGIMVHCVEHDMIDLLPPGLLDQAVNKGLIRPEHRTIALEIQKQREALRRQHRAFRSDRATQPSDR